MTKRDQALSSKAVAGHGGWSLSNAAAKGANGLRKGPTLIPGFPGHKHWHGDDRPVSPGTVESASSDYFVSAPQTPSKEQGPYLPPFQDRRHESPQPHFPAAVGSRQPPPAQLGRIAPWTSDSSTISSAVRYPPPHGPFNDDDRGFQSRRRPSMSRTHTGDSLDPSWYEGERRPSVASSTTLGSEDSRKYQGNGRGSMSNSSMVTPTPSVHSLRLRKNSLKNGKDGRSSPPSALRPKTPLPSADVVPWVFQDFEDIPQYGNAPIRQAPAGPDKQRFENDCQPTGPNLISKFHFPHRHTRSKDDVSKPSPQEGAGAPALRPPLTGRKSDFLPRSTTAMPNRGQPGARSTSPAPSTGSSNTSQHPSADGSLSVKRGIFGKLRRHKHENGAHDTVKTPPKSQPSPTPSRTAALEPFLPRKARDASVAASDGDMTIRPSEPQQVEVTARSRKESKAKLFHGHGKASTPSKRVGSLESSSATKASAAMDSYWDLDTDLSHMEGIVSQPAVGGFPFAGAPGLVPLNHDEPYKESWERATSAAPGPGAWDAPDSWAVKKIEDENKARLREIDEEGPIPQSEDTGVPHCLRVFRIDHTFATLSLGVNTTVAEILQVLGKKSFLQDDLNNYQIIMKKTDLQRQLAPGERPIAIQKRLLEQAGYERSDGIEKIGQEDNSYLCRFTFIPTKISGYYSLDRDSGLEKMSKFSNVDLSGRSLVTIPIILYKKAVEIISLNLSRNLALDLPRDFIQSCSHLREIKYTGNEAYQLPASLCLASRLTVLDISNNRLEQLDHVELGKLQNLGSLKLSNNKLSYLPRYFTNFRALRILNLSSNYLRRLPDFLGELKSLIDLDVSFNSIEQMPQLGQMVSLERLWATNNNLGGTFPEDVSRLENLKEIDARFNAITSIDVLSRLPNLEQLMIGHNSVSSFEGSFAKLRVLAIDHNPITRFDFKAAIPTLTVLNLASAKIVQLDDSFFEHVSNLTKLILDRNHFAALSNQIGKLQKLEHFSIAKNPLMTFPPTIGCLQELRYLDARECNVKKLPVELWYCSRLESLNLSSNVLDSFPKLSPSVPLPSIEPHSSQSSLFHTGQSYVSSSPSQEEMFGTLEELNRRRQSQASAGMLSVGSSPGASTRKNSINSVYGPGARKTSMISRAPTFIHEGSSLLRKDSNLAGRSCPSFASSLRNLSLADNRLNDEIFEMITMCTELRTLNLSYNDLDDIPAHALRKWPNLIELYLSGNELSSLPSEDLHSISSLRVLHLNGNKFQTLPAELAKIQKLVTLDVGCNSLKYNVSNWPYDWNWVWNPNLRYLNFSGNRRLEIKPNSSFQAGQREGADLTNFNSLQHLRVLGLMDLTLTIPHIPDESDDRRIRTSGSMIGTMKYGMADSLGRNEHLSILDLVVPKFRGHDGETLLGMFDGQTMSAGGSKVARFLQENFKYYFAEQLSELAVSEGPRDALRRTFLTLNKDLATVASETWDAKEHRFPQSAQRGSTAVQSLNAEDIQSGGVATVLFLQETELFVANVGDAQAMLMPSDGSFKILTRKHDPADANERERIREAGSYVSRHGKLNDVLDVSRAFGYVSHVPAVMASPNIMQITLKEQDEMVLIASKELWDYLTPDVVIDVARSERGDVMRAAQKLRDLAISFGATGKIMVMVIGVAGLKKRREISSNRGTLTMASSQGPDNQVVSKRGRRPKDGPDDSTLARLDREVDAPTGELAMVFTDIKSSTALWEANPVAMRSAIKIHNDLLRRQLRIIGGYEVKTEGDAFIVSFPTATSALRWCFSVQSQLLAAPWPTEILDSPHGQEVQDSDQNTIYRGLSVRMGIHWGSPVCEPDPITRRMDYFGPMVNRAARISAVADGGEITCSSDFIAEIERILETFVESDRSTSTGSEDGLVDDAMGQAIRRDLRVLSAQGFEVKEIGERKLKGLENPETIFLMYPHSLAGRIIAAQLRKTAEAAAAENPATFTRDSRLGDIEAQHVWDIWGLSLRLEMLCSSLECPGAVKLRPPETGILERMKKQGGEVADSVLVQFMEHLTDCINTLTLRNMLRPFSQARNILETAAPMQDLFSELADQLTELRGYRTQRLQADVGGA